MNRSFVWLVVVALAAGCASADRKHFENIDQAGRAIESAITEKADLERYRSLVSAYSSQLEQAGSDISSAQERSRFSEYEAVESNLRDLLLVWEEKNARQQELLPLASPLASRVAKQYDLPVNTNEPPSIYASEAMQTIWNAAKAKMDALAAE